MMASTETATTALRILGLLGIVLGGIAITGFLLICSAANPAIRERLRRLASPHGHLRAAAHDSNSSTKVPRHRVPPQSIRSASDRGKHLVLGNLMAALPVIHMGWRRAKTPNMGCRRCAAQHAQRLRTPAGQPMAHITRTAPTQPSHPPHTHSSAD
jgi:hypothetical protein